MRPPEGTTRIEIRPVDGRSVEAVFLDADGRRLGDVRTGGVGMPLDVAATVANVRHTCPVCASGVATVPTLIGDR